MSSAEDTVKTYLADLAGAVLAASIVAPGESIGDGPPNTTGGPLVRPGGRDCYPAFWVRDFAMSLESGLIDRDLLRHAIVVTAAAQPHVGFTTTRGSSVPAWSIPDHIAFDGRPIFFPGSMDPDDQGHPFGRLPSFDDHYYFVEMVAHYLRTGPAGEGAGGVDTHDPAGDLLAQPIAGVSLIDRLERGFAVPPVDDETDLVACADDNRGVGFGFRDTVVHTGKLLFASVLRLRAAEAMAFVLEVGGRSRDADAYRAKAARIRSAIADTFADPHGGGILLASTGRSAQPDVWGSAFAVYSGALTPAGAARVSRALADGLATGTIVWDGSIRHVPTDRDFDEHSAWLRMVSDAFPKNRYQNGAYWDTPVGWVYRAVLPVAPKAADDLLAAYLAALRRDDFRQGPEFGGPYECRHPDGDHRQNPVYLASVTAPLGAIGRSE